jgi:hypothetical protein
MLDRTAIIEALVNGKSVSNSSGIVIDARGYILTCAHIFGSPPPDEPAEWEFHVSVFDKFEPRWRAGTVCAYAPKQDVMVIKTEMLDAKPAPIVADIPLYEGDEVAIAGYISLSGRFRPIVRRTTLCTIPESGDNFCLLGDVPAPGMSGGPVFLAAENESAVVGMNIGQIPFFSHSPSLVGLGLMMPAQRMMDILEHLKPGFADGAEFAK